MSEYDCCIVGSGAGAAPLVSRLTQAERLLKALGGRGVPAFPCGSPPTNLQAG